MGIAIVLERSFVMLPGIGLRTERNLWKQGISDWAAFGNAREIRGISKKRLEVLRACADRIGSLEAEGRLRELGDLLPSGERWRLLRDWDDRYAAIDVEVVRKEHDVVPVVVSLLRGEGTCRSFIRGDDLTWKNIASALYGADFIVTFNGSSFDLPILLANGFPVGGRLQIDLRRYAPRAGLPGGLKRIESEIGIKRPREMEFATSEQVAYLWRLWEERGSKNALDLMIRYNRNDVTSLVKLAGSIYERLSVRTSINRVG
jgi:hypothetical protein